MGRSEERRQSVYLHAHGGGAGGGHVGLRSYRSRSLHRGKCRLSCHRRQTGWGEGRTHTLSAVLSLQASPPSLCARGSWTPSAVCSSPQVSPASNPHVWVQLCLGLTGSSAHAADLGPVTSGLLSGLVSGDLLIRRQQTPAFAGTLCWVSLSRELVLRNRLSCCN